MAHVRQSFVSDIIFKCSCVNLIFNESIFSKIVTAYLLWPDYKVLCGGLLALHVLPPLRWSLLHLPLKWLSSEVRDMQNFTWKFSTTLNIIRLQNCFIVIKETEYKYLKFSG